MALVTARNQLLDRALNDKLLANVRPNGREDAPQFRLNLDAQKASAFGLTMADVDNTLCVAWGGRYINDFFDRRRVKRAIVQADAPFRMVPEDFNRWTVLWTSLEVIGHRAVEHLVGASGIEPPTTTMSRWCSTTELRA
jgi:multidrug efflux pump